MSQLIIYGNINSDGTVYSGTKDYTIERIGTGMFKINFNNDFVDVPSACTTQNYRNWGDFGYRDGSTTDNTVIVAVNKASMLVKTGGGDGSAGNRNFSFIIIGNVK